MSEDNNSDNGNPSEKKPAAIEKFSEDEKREIIEKMKKFLASEDDEKVMLYAALAKLLL
jgi:hypothetical protein